MLPDDLPFVTGSIGLLGTKPSYELMEGCDTLLMVGSSFPYTECLPEPGQARGVQIDIDARMLGIRYPMEVNLVGDARDTLRALLPLLERKADRAWREEIEGEVERWWALLDDQAHAGRPTRSTRSSSSTSSRPRLPDGCDPDRRLRLGDELVGAPPAPPPRHARRALRHPGDDGPGGAVRARRQVRPPGPPGDRLERRRRDADAASTR